MTLASRPAWIGDCSLTVEFSRDQKERARGRCLEPCDGERIECGIDEHCAWVPLHRPAQRGENTIRVDRRRGGSGLRGRQLRPESAQRQGAPVGVEHCKRANERSVEVRAGSTESVGSTADCPAVGLCRQADRRPLRAPSRSRFLLDCGLHRLAGGARVLAGAVEGALRVALVVRLAPPPATPTPPPISAPIPPPRTAPRPLATPQLDDRAWFS